MPSSSSIAPRYSVWAQNDVSVPLEQFGAPFMAGPWQLTLSQAIRGADAVAQIVAANDQNAGPVDGIDFVLFSVEAKNIGQQTSWIDYDDFAMVGGSGIVYRSLELIPPDPILRATVEPGASTTGWVVGAIESNEPQPVVLFDPRILSGSWADRAIAVDVGSSFPTTGGLAQPVNEVGTNPGSPAGVGETIVTADWVLELEQAVFGQDVYDRTDFRTQAVGDSDPSFIPYWAAIRVRITNNASGAMSSHFPATAFALSWADGSPVRDVSRLTPPLPDISRDYLPGASFTGWAAFERPFDFEGTVVRFQPFRTDVDVRYLTWGDGFAPANSDAPAEDINEIPSAPDEIFSAGDSVVTTEDQVNLRDESSQYGGIITVLELGSELTITGSPIDADGFTWYPVEDGASGANGFIASNFIRAA